MSCSRADCFVAANSALTAHAFRPVVAYGRNFLAADELDVLPPGSAIEQMLADYQVMRIKYCVSEKHYGETQPLTGNATRNKSR